MKITGVLTARLIVFNLLFSLLFASSSLAAKYYNSDQKKKIDNYITHGVITGGHQGHGFSLLNIRRKFYKSKKIDRLIMDIGTATLKDHFGEPCYFHISLDKNKKLLIVDLHQIYKSKFEFDVLVKKLKSSPYIKSVKLVKDFDEKTTSIVAKLKTSVKIESYSIVGKMLKTKKRRKGKARVKAKTSRIILDIKKI